MTRNHLGDFEALVLAAVVRGGEEANGVRVYREIETRTDRVATVTAVHVTLRRLETKGLLSSVEGTPSERGGRPRRYYRPTAAGASALADHRAMWQSMWRGLRIPDPEDA